MFASKNSPPKNYQFRNDINGLRAWAVIAVVLYHFNIPGFTGGFIGVDIFFVISGFLMTGIIVSGLETNNFSLWNFYLARARRIIPPLLVLCSALLIFGWFWLPTIDYRPLGSYVARAIIFISNIKFWKEAGYFDADSHEKWLLHTWSLSVEWQFYILLPIALMLIWRWWSKRGLIVGLLTTAIASFLLAVYTTQYWPEAAFYLLPSRAWEMLAGGIIWWLINKNPLPERLSRRTEILGLLLIVLSIYLFNTTISWPGGYAVFPVTGAMMVLASARQQSIFTTNPLAQWLGTNSYSIYLWHWPIVVWLNYASLQHELSWIVSGLFITLILGELSYRFVETPTRQTLAKFNPIKSWAILITSVVVINLMVVGVRYQNISGRLPSNVELAANESKNRSPRQSECFDKAISGHESPKCIFGGNQLKAIVMGDSHANAIISAVQTALPSATQGVMELTYPSCPTLLGAHRTNPKYHQCTDFNNWAVDKLISSYIDVPVIIVNRTTAAAYGVVESDATTEPNQPLVYFSNVVSTPTPDFLEDFNDSLVKTACTIAKHRTVYLVRPIPEMGINVPKFLSRSLMFKNSDPQISISLTDYYKRHSSIWRTQDEAAQRCGVKILNPLPYLCSNGHCWGSKNGRPLYFDDDHLSEYGNKLLVPMFKQIFVQDSI